MVTRTRIHPGDGDPRHGTPNGYNNLHCTCKLCTEAWRVYHLNWMHQASKKGPAHDRLAKHAERQRNKRKKNQT